MQRRRTLILTGFVLALAAMLPVTALAGAWAVVCTSGDGSSHIELAHQPTGCEHEAEQHSHCGGGEHDHPPVPCEDRSLDLNDMRVPDRPTEQVKVDLPLPVLLFLFAPQFPVSVIPAWVDAFSLLHTGPPPG